MDNINFEFNWNNKLKCTYFTTFRLHNPKKYVTGNVLKVSLKEYFMKEVVVVDVKTLLLEQVNEFMAGIDTGYPLGEFKKIVSTMYKNKVTDIERQKFDFILLKTLPNKQVEQGELQFK